MSSWHEIDDVDIDLELLYSHVNLLVTCNDDGNVYAILTFDQIKKLHEKIIEIEKQ